ncbi:hypothetical protein QJQ45_013595, partial [Haematococcus lacustris]
PSGLISTARKAEAIAKEVQAQNELLTTEARLQQACEEFLEAALLDLEEKHKHLQASHRQQRLDNESLEAVVKQQELAVTTAKCAQHRLEAQLRKYKRRPQLTRKQRQQLQILKQTGVSIEVLRRWADSNCSRLDTHGRPGGTTVQPTPEPSPPEPTPGPSPPEPSDFFIPTQEAPSGTPAARTAAFTAQHYLSTAKLMLKTHVSRRRLPTCRRLFITEQCVVANNYRPGEHTTMGRQQRVMPLQNAAIRAQPCYSHGLHNTLLAGLTALGAGIKAAIEDIASLLAQHWGELSLARSGAKPETPCDTRWASHTTAAASVIRVWRLAGEAVARVVEGQRERSPPWAVTLSGFFKDTDLLLKICVVAVVGKSLLQPELLWASQHDGLHAFELYRHTQAVQTSLSQTWTNSSQLLSDMQGQLQHLVPAQQRQQLEHQLLTYLQVHCKAMSSYYEQHVQMQNALPGLFAALGSSDTTTRWEAAQEVVNHAEMMQQQQEDQQQQQGVEGQQQKRTRQRLPMCDPRVWDAHGTWEKHEKQICAMADMQELSEQDQQQLQSHLEVYYLACPVSNAPVESLLQLLKHGTGMFMELPALLELMSMRIHIDAIDGVDVLDFAQQLPGLRKEVRREEAAAARVRRTAKAEMKAAAANHRVGQVVVDVGDHEGQHRLEAAYALTYDGRDYSHTTIEEANKLSVRELQAYLRFHQQEVMKGWLKPKLKGFVMAHIRNSVAGLHGDEQGAGAGPDAGTGAGAAPELPTPPAAPPWQQLAAGAGAAPGLPTPPAGPPWQQLEAGAGAAPGMPTPPAAPPWQQLEAGASAAPGLPTPPAAPPWQHLAAGAGAAPGMPTPPAAPPWQQLAAGAGAAPELPTPPAAPPWQQVAAGASAAPGLPTPPAAPPWQQLAAGAGAAPGLPTPPAAPPWQQLAAGAGAAPGMPTPPSEQQGVRAELDTSSTRKRRAGGRDRTQHVDLEATGPRRSRRSIAARPA